MILSEELYFRIILISSKVDSATMFLKNMFLLLCFLFLFTGCTPKSSTITFSQEANTATTIDFQENYFDNSVQLNLSAFKYFNTIFSHTFVKINFQLSYHDTLANRITVNLEDAFIRVDNVLLTSVDYHVSGFPIQTDSMCRDILYFNKLVQKDENSLKDEIYFFLSEAVLFDNKPLLPDTIKGVITNQ